MKVMVQDHSRLLVIVAALFGLVACGKWPPVVNSARDVEGLSIDEPSVRARGLADEHIHTLERMQNMRFLCFASGMAVKDAKITDEGIEILASLDMPLLDSISLGYNSNITDRVIADLATMSPLKLLVLTACPQITDVGLIDLSRRATIESLVLDGCEGITDEGVLQLVNLHGLERLSLDGCPNVTSEAVASLQRALPNAKIRKNDEAWRDLNRNR